MPSRARILTRIALVAVLSCCLAPPSQADRSVLKKPAAGESGSLYEKGVAAVKAQKYAEALPLFEKADQLDKDNPDTLNMLAYTQRKLGKIDIAIENYQRALKLRPNFPQAREYLGEAYLQAAMRELQALKSGGAEGQKEAEVLIKALNDAAASARKGGGKAASGGGKASW
jgi:tetratricopeptide (TPR) repeat protein